MEMWIRCDFEDGITRCLKKNDIKLLNSLIAEHGKVITVLHYRY